MNRLTERDKSGAVNIIRLPDDGMKSIYELLYNTQVYLLSAALNKLAEYEDAEEQGRLVRLPCKVGDTVYEVQKDGTIQKWYISSFEKYDGVTWKASAKDRKNKWRYIERTFSFESFGETVFLTRGEAAEAWNRKAEK